MAAEALTAKRRAACRIVLPPSTTRTIRSRRSWDKGAVMINSTALTPSTLESEHLIPCKTEPLYGWNYYYSRHFRVVLLAAEVRGHVEQVRSRSLVSGAGGGR